jgi:hypothetical protein
LKAFSAPSRSPRPQVRVGDKTWALSSGRARETTPSLSARPLSVSRATAAGRPGCIRYRPEEMGRQGPVCGGNGATLSRPPRVPVRSPALATAWTLRTAPLRAQPVHRDRRDRGVDHTVVGPGLRWELPARCCRTRPHRWPFDPEDAVYQTGPKRCVCRRVRRGRRATAGHLPVPVRPPGFGVRTTNGRDFRPSTVVVRKARAS